MVEGSDSSSLKPGTVGTWQNQMLPASSSFVLLVSGSKIFLMRLGNTVLSNECSHVIEVTLLLEIGVLWLTCSLLFALMT
jgi:hypothetical protein